MTYFSEREEGERPREDQEIGEPAWGGIHALVHARVADGSFGASYSETCEDGAGPVGTDESAFWQAMRAEIPNLDEQVQYGIPWKNRREPWISLHVRVARMSRRGRNSRQGRSVAPESYRRARSWIGRMNASPFTVLRPSGTARGPKVGSSQSAVRDPGAPRSGDVGLRASIS